MNKVISTYTTTLEAYIIAGRLEAEGIPTFVTNTHHILADWSLSIALGGVRVEVSESYLSEATNILQNIEDGVFELVQTEEVSKSQIYCCSKCNSKNITFKLLGWKIALIAIFLIQLPLPYSLCSNKCMDCNNSWRRKIYGRIPC